MTTSDPLVQAVAEALELACADGCLDSEHMRDAEVAVAVLVPLIRAQESARIDALTAAVRLAIVHAENLRMDTPEDEATRLDYLSTLRALTEGTDRG